MARIQYVKRAQQRYATKPVIDPETGQQKKVPLMGRNGEQLRDKRGNLRWQRQSVRDLDRPKPMPRCDFPDCEDREIKPGTPYVYVDLVHGTKYRHAEHPRWQPWDLTGAMWAQIARVVSDAEDALDALGDFEEASDVSDAMQAAADEARGLAEQRTEAADNMESGFGHETESSSMLREHADNIEAWADALEQWDADDSPPEPDEYDRDEQGDELDAPDEADDGDRYNGEGTSLADAWVEWREGVLDSAREALNDTPEV